MGEFGDKLGLIIGIVLLVLLFLLVGRGFRIGRKSGKAPKWQRPEEPQRDEPEKARRKVVPRRAKLEKQLDKRKHDKRDDHPGRGRKD